jgi:predicted nucleotidyltransferase
MKSYFDYLLSREKYFKNYLEYAKILKDNAKKILKDKKLRVLVFGSVVENDFTLSSDIDVLIISNKAPMKGVKRGKILGKIYASLGKAHPFEIHLITQTDWDKWYRRFVKSFIEA